MSLDDKQTDASVERSAETNKKQDVLSDKETKETQEGAAGAAQERKRFLENSLGKAFSPSTEVLKDMVVNIYEGAKKIVGELSGEVPKAVLEAVRNQAKVDLSDTAQPQEALENRKSGVIEKPGEVIFPPQVITGDYRGEEIKRDVPPAVTVNTKGEKLETIAREHLGPGASPEEVQKHVNEIARINKIDHPEKPLDGKPLTLPGHTADGGMVMEDADHNKRTVWQDGKVRVENESGTGYVRTPGEGGAYTEHHTGPRPSDNYELRRTADGKFEVADAGKDNFQEPPKDADDPRVERAKLRELADATITDPKERAQFEADMAKFDGRAKELQERFEKQGHSKEEAAKMADVEVAKTYKQIEKLLEAGDNPKLPLTERDRVMLAEQVMHQAADPTDVSQGGYNTCNVTTIESATYAKNPSEAARLVTDVATTGKYRTNGDPPVEVEVPKGSLEKHGEAKEAHEPGSNHRSYASQIFAVTATNVHYAKENAKHDPPGQLKYEQRKPGPDSGPNPDNGERLYDYSKKDPATGRPPQEVTQKVRDENGKEKEVPLRSPGLSREDIADVAKEINPQPPDGKKDGPVRIDFDPDGKISEINSELKMVQAKTDLLKHGIIEGSDLKLDDPESFKKAREAVDRKEGLDQPTKDRLKEELREAERERYYHNENGIALVRDEKQFNEALAKLKEEGRLPIIVGVDTRVKPFADEAGDPKGGAHVVTITDYNPGPPPKVSYDNQWSKDSDRSGDKAVSPDELFKNMRHRDSEARKEDLQKDIDDARAKGKPNYQKEAEMLKMKKESGEMKDDKVADAIVKSFEEMQKDKNLSPDDRKRALNELKEIRDKLPPDEQKRVNDQLVALVKQQKAQGAAP